MAGRSTPHTAIEIAGYMTSSGPHRKSFNRPVVYLASVLIRQHFRNAKDNRAIKQRQHRIAQRQGHLGRRIAL